MNVILNISDMMKNDESLNSDLQSQIQLIWSSGKFLEYNIQCELSQMQIE